jgi:DNA-binding CsgD family transcriptional regulator
MTLYNANRDKLRYNAENKELVRVAYLKVSEAAEKWNMSRRRVQDLCRLKLIPGVQRWGRDWMIPADAVRPPDGRSKAGKAAKGDAAGYVPLLRKSPILLMTDLYNVSGSADECIAVLDEYPESQALMLAEITYIRGEIDEVYRHAREILDSRSGFYAMLAGGMLLAMVAMWKGDIKLWNEAHGHFYNAPCKNDMDRDIVALAVASTDIEIRDTNKFPDWFARGCFDNLPRDAHPAARVYYIKHLLIFAQECALGNLKPKDMGRLGPMKMLPYIIEPMISQMVAEKVVLAEAYLRLMAAIVYHQIGSDARGGAHLDKAIRLCLAEGFYAPLVEHRRQLRLFLDDHLARIDPQALKKVKMLHKQLHAGWTKLHNAALDRSVQETLTVREREVARLAAFGLTNQEIAQQLSLSAHTVRSLLDSARDKIGVDRRVDLALYI